MKTNRISRRNFIHKAALTGGVASIAPFGTAGVTITETGIWDPNFYCGSVNMEKVFLPTYEYLKQIAGIKNKYGRKIGVTTLHEEEWTIIESISPDVLIKDIVTEFNLKSHIDSLRGAEIIQNKSRVQK